MGPDARALAHDGGDDARDGAGEERDGEGARDGCESADDDSQPGKANDEETRWGDAGDYTGWANCENACTRYGLRAQRLGEARNPGPADGEERPPQPDLGDVPILE